ncbi:MAG: hypothetical protein ACRED9_13755, partial [Caulobacteraceae bacterium]
RSGGVGVQLHVHGARRSRKKAMPLATPIPSSQPPGTEHESRGLGKTIRSFVAPHECEDARYYR